MKSIKKILIANRGEIALRIIKTCRELGIGTVAVFSDSDKNSLFVSMADEAIHIGNSPASESYLDIEKIIKAANKSGADAIHPGYGFLAENSAFAKKCEIEGIVFIGPSSDSIEKMGSKAGAKNIMKSSGVPVVTGYEGEDQSFNILAAEAQKIGFPVLLKPSAGGGGKGMRIVRKMDELKVSVETAQREAKSSFGSDRLIIEKYFDTSRHIEFQIFGDMHGNAIHLFERECTIQRRHQKIIEESPSPVLTADLRKRMSEAAVRAAKAINYYNAGTVEFILNEKNEFFFLEVNTRLQVEHPVTEAITGLDLVKMQIEIAEGKKLESILPVDFTNRADNKNIYALECRLYAEDPSNNFLPQTGNILLWKPFETIGVRYDTGIISGNTIDIFYDPMIAKIISHGNNRMEVIRKMIYSLENTVCLGINTNKEFLIHILKNEEFERGNYNTQFAGEVFFNSKSKEQDERLTAVSAFLYCWNKREMERRALKNLPSAWRNNFSQKQKEQFLSGETELLLEYEIFPENKFRISCLDKCFELELILCTPNHIKFIIEDHLHSVFIAGSGENIFVHLPGSGQKSLKLISRFPQNKGKESLGNYKSPMPGEVVKVSVNPGDAVKKGDTLLVLLSMKMENTILAHGDGIVEEIFVKEKSFVVADTLLLKMKTE